MANIFIFTAGDPAARAHLADSIINPVAPEKIFNNFEAAQHDQLRAIKEEGEGFYAWGAVPGPQNIPRWEAMQIGDYALCVFDSRYQYVSKVLGKFNNQRAARAIWKTDPNGNTWQYMYFLTKPRLVSVAIADLGQYLNNRYMGFAKISDAKLQEILTDFDSLDHFIDQKIHIHGKVPDMPIQDPSNEDPLSKLIAYIRAQGFVFAPWQIACYVTALRTKPFVILAGVSGTGKSKLPALVAEATGGCSRLIPVRPDWTDSADVIGYKNLQDRFQSGHLLQYIAEAQKAENKSIQHVCIIDEMNLARVEHYFAEVLSRIEDRERFSDGYRSKPLVVGELIHDDRQWGQYGLSPNLAIVGTVNMDESTHGFSKKVLDRAFTIELSDVDLDILAAVTGDKQVERWPLVKWSPRAISLGELIDQLSDEENALVDKAIEVLKEVNAILVQAQLQVGYRTRDEIALFVLHAQESLKFFKTEQGEKVDPLDLALLMKILPRIAGGSSPVRATVLGLLGWAYNGKRFDSEQEAESLLDDWKSNGQPGALSSARFPRMTARLCLMLERLRNDGFTSFWL